MLWRNPVCVSEYYCIKGDQENMCLNCFLSCVCSITLSLFSKSVESHIYAKCLFYNATHSFLLLYLLPWLKSAWKLKCCVVYIVINSRAKTPLNILISITSAALDDYWDKLITMAEMTATVLSSDFNKYSEDRIYVVQWCIMLFEIDMTNN